MELNATAAERSSLGPSSGTRAPSRPSPNWWAASASLSAGRTRRAPSRSATATEPTISASPTPARTIQAVATPLLTSLSGTWISITAMSPEPSAVGWRSAEPPPDTLAVVARPILRVWVTACSPAQPSPMSTGASSPIAGTWTAIRPAAPICVDSTALRSWTGSVVMERVGPMVAACRSALEKARSLAISWTTSPRGTAKATTTMAVTARHTLTSAHLTPAAPV